MALPTFDDNLHDIGINGYGWMILKDPAQVAGVMLQDWVPGQSRSALGEGENDSFEGSSFMYQNDWEAGQGQGKLRAQDRCLSSLGDGRFQGHFFPQKKKLTATGGATGGHFTLSGTPYGFLAATIENLLDGTSAAGATDIPRLGQRGIPTATGSIMWVDDDNDLWRWPGSGAASDVTTNLPSDVTPYNIDRLGRFLWVIGQRTLESSGTLVQSKLGLAGNALAGVTAITANFDSVPRSNSTLVVFIFTEHGVSTSVTLDGDPPEGWVLRSSSTNDNGIAAITGFCFTCEQPKASNQSTSFRFAGDGTPTLLYYLATEFVGVDLLNPFLDIADNAEDTSGYNSGTVSATTGINIFIAADTANGATSTTPASYTDLSPSHNRGGISFHAYYRADTTDTTVTPGAPSGDTLSVNFLLKLRSNAITSDISQTVVLYSSDDGFSWEEAFQGDSSGIPLPITTMPAQGALWITTATGLYELRYQEREFEDHTVKVLAGIEGPKHEFIYPADADTVGTALAIFDGALYYNLGATLWRYPPNGNAEQIWPTHSWGTVGGKVTAVVAGENGIYFSGGGYLWCYNGFGFHQLAKEAVAGEFDYLHWNDGRLYFKGDPAPYFDFGYPSLRPDLYTTAPDSFTTGYVISSMVNFEKIAETKVVRRFETQAEFTDGTNAAESGTIQLQYLIADDGDHPDRFAPDSNTPTWVNIGTAHSVADGNVKTYSLATPITFQNLYLRAVLTPGTVGYPILEGYGVDGEALLPDRDRINAPLAINTAVTDKAGTQLYPTDAEVVEAMDALDDLRDGTVKFFNVGIVRRRGTSVTKVCVAETINTWIESTIEGGDDSTEGFGYQIANAQVQLKELP